MDAVVKAVEAEKPDLKHVETVDKSGPAIPTDVHIKKIDRTGFLNEVQAEHQLKHAETADRSTPQIGEDVHIKKIDRQGFLAEVVKAAEK